MGDNEHFGERRKYVRVQWSQDIECNTMLDSNTYESFELSETLKLECKNISLGGISLLSSKSIEEGTLLLFNITIDTICYEVTTRVIYCIPKDDMYQVGIEFVSPSNKLINHIRRLVTRLSFNNSNK